MDFYKILAVDDDSVDLAAIKRCLRNEKSINNKHIEVTTCQSGEECINFLKKNECDLVLLDYRMPLLDGYETCKLINKLKPDLPVIMLTGMADDKSLIRAFEAGVVDYITKPLKKIEIITRINNALKIKDSADKLKKSYSALMKDLSVASKVQSYLLPDRFWIRKNILFSSLYQAAGKVSGDLFDIIDISENKYCIYIGDISGHGVQAALIMSAIQTVIKLFVGDSTANLQLHVILDKLNRMMVEKFSYSNYMTILIGIVDLEAKTFQYHTAGHPPIITYNTKTYDINMSKDCGELPVGMLKETVYSENQLNTISLDQDILYFLYTDGIFESCKGDKVLGLEGFLDVIKKLDPIDNIGSIQEKILELIKKMGFDFDDDVSLFSFQLFGTNKFPLFFELSPKLKKVSETVEKIISGIESYKLGEELEAKVELVTTELLTNIVMHGLDIKGVDIPIRILLKVDRVDSSIVFTFWDHGMAWNPMDYISSEEGPLFTEDDVFKTSGRGIKIIKTLSKSFNVVRYNNINETIICF
jgi:phosphoserine phosphatase RsbU/P